MRVADLTVEAGGHRLLESIDLTVEPGELVALTGPSGSGKSVLATTVVGAFRGQPGRVSGTVDRERVAWLPQDGRRSLDPLRPIGRQASAQALERVGLADVAERYPHQLSGGMAKRAALAHALSQNAPFLVVDEPCSGVDTPLQARIHQVLREEAESGRRVLWITHDIAAARDTSHRIASLSAGRLVDPPRVDSPVPAGSTHPRGSVLMKASGLGFAYRSWFRRTPVLRGLNLTLHAGERVALVGPSGSGKSTLARLLVGLLRPSEGHVDVVGGPPQPGRHTQLLTQDPRDLLVEDLPLGLLLRQSARLHGRSEADAARALDTVGLAHRADAVPATLSGGEMRRAGIARCSLARARAWIADEPVAGLDAPLRRSTARVLFDAVGPEAALLFITHDEAFAASAADRVLRLHAGALT